MSRVEKVNGKQNLFIVKYNVFFFFLGKGEGGGGERGGREP